jgi:hypothetical protein
VESALNYGFPRSIFSVFAYIYCLYLNILLNIGFILLFCHFEASQDMFLGHFPHLDLGIENLNGENSLRNPQLFNSSP